MKLLINWATHDATAYACKHWHYSKTVPAGKTIKIGVWEDDQFIGVVIFSRGANNNLGKPYGLTQLESCELTRIALRAHVTPVSRIVAIAIKLLKKHSPGVRLIISFADSAQGHHGGVYQAGGWVYCGSVSAGCLKVFGKVHHLRSLYKKYESNGKGSQSLAWLRANVDPNAEAVNDGAKHRYLFPLDKKIAAAIEPLRKKYPKRAKRQDIEHPSMLGGSIPTRTLQPES